MRSPAFLLAALALALAACGSAPPAAADAAAVANGSAWGAPPVFPTLTGRVVDQANLLPAAEEQRLTAASDALEREVGPQYVIVTVSGLQGRSIEDFGVQLGRAWGIGSRAHNDGILLIVAPNERKVRIEVGLGLERRVTDPYAARVINERILPRFREGDYPGGIDAGSAAIIARLRSRQTDAEIAAEDHIL
ncbi:MAG: TPM domain-containing protein [Sphingomonadaceae bacterium]|nr:TPM domain-containing protein [Sphingomonadaceae bacterium]